MDIQEYLDRVTGQIRNKKARELTVNELQAHIEDQAAAYENSGCSPEEAALMAVKEMGDPVQVGMELDRLHRPQFPTGMVCFIMLISLISIMVQYNRTHAVFVLAGIGCMLGICLLDYTIVGKYGRFIAGAFLAVLTIAWKCSHLTINGASRWIQIGPAAMDGSVLVLLYLPLFGGILYAYRGQRYRCIFKILIWMLLPVLWVLRMPALSMALIMLLAETCMFGTALKDGWYHVSAGKTFLVTIICPSIAGLVCILRVFCLADYQKARLLAWITRSGPESYLFHSLHMVFSQVKLFGLSQSAMQSLKTIPEVKRDYVLVYMAARFGIVPVILFLIMIGLLFFWMYREIRKQKNCLGMMVGTGSITVITLQFILNITMLLGWVPMTNFSIPFLSYTGSGTLVTYIMTGLVLSIYRNKSIVRDPKPIRIVRRRQYISAD
jgi:cell division protein FtsW (lipid II flippase)